jgi:hypothetical protein
LCGPGCGSRGCPIGPSAPGRRPARPAAGSVQARPWLPQRVPSGLFCCFERGGAA